MEYRTERIMSRVTPSELNIIEERMKITNLNISEYLRQSALQKEIIVIEDLKEFTKELRGIGKNLNQLVILSHQGKIVSLNLDTMENQIAEIIEKLDLLTTQIKR